MVLTIRFVHLTIMTSTGIAFVPMAKSYLWPTVGVKTGGSRVVGPKQCVLGSMVTGGKGHNVYPGSGPLDGGKTLLLLD